jgi:hypothetical protein
MPEESQVEGGEHQDDANIRYQTFPKAVPEERDIYSNDDSYHHYRVKYARYPSVQFRGNRHVESSIML